MGIAHTLHMVRHGLASLLLNSNPGSIHLIAALLGDTISTVERHYAWVSKLTQYVESQQAIVDLGSGAALRGRL